MDQESLGARIRRFRKARGKGLKEAKPRNKSVSWMSRMENGEIGDLSVPDLIEIARNLYVHPGELGGIVPGVGELLPLPPAPEPAIDERIRQLAEIGEKVVAMVQQQSNIVPGPAIRIVPLARSIPIVNGLSASQLGSGERQVEQWIEVTAAQLNGATDPVGFIIMGDCLFERWGIRTGDTLIVDAANKEPRDGQIVAARINDSAETAKEYYRVTGGVDLRPTSPGYDAIGIRGSDELFIIGVYVTHLVGRR